MMFQLTNTKEKGKMNMNKKSDWEQLKAQVLDAVPPLGQSRRATDIIVELLAKGDRTGNVASAMPAP